MTDSRYLAQKEFVAEVKTFIAEGTGHDVVPAIIEGRDVLLAFELDSDEHSRRQSHCLGPVRSKGLLHALWALPAGIPWPISGLDRLDAATLRDEGAGFFTIDENSLTRVYQPAGRVQAIGLPATRLAEAVDAAGRFPPIFRRYAASSQVGRADDHAVAMALTLGVGAAVIRPSSWSVLAQAAPPRLGVPSVYRWWLAEVAYRAWTQTNAH